jgi:glycosyltransferase involved in cell wall biosynthesis
MGVLGWGVKSGEKESGPWRTFQAGRQPWLAETINAAVDQFAPDVVLTHGPLSVLGAMMDVALRPFVTWVGYGAFEAGPLREQELVALSQMDRAVVPSAWCRKTAAAAGASTDLQVIRLGVDLQVFRPLPDRADLRERAGLEDRFVVGCVARNTFRKQIPILLRAFAAFARHHPEAMLYLHTDPDDAGWELQTIADRHGLAERVAFTRGLAGAVGVSPESLNAVYNLFDIMVLPSMGESFGLPVLEAMAAGVPVCATDCSALRELVSGRGELIAVKDWVTMPWGGADYALADAEDMEGKLEQLHRDADLRAQHRRAGREYARRLTWNRSAGAWQRLLESCREEEANVTGDHRRSVAPAFAIAADEPQGRTYDPFLPVDEMLCPARSRRVSDEQ